MGLWDLIKSKIMPDKAEAPTPPIIPERRVDGIILSQYSNMPRYFVIGGVKYDLDNPEDIDKLPLIDKIIQFQGKDYGIDSVLLEHGLRSFYDSPSIFGAAIRKFDEYRENGITFVSDAERIWGAAALDKLRQRHEKEELRRKQCDSFTIDDMQQFPDIPFGWSWVPDLFHTDGEAWFMLNMNNQQVAQDYISVLNDHIIDAHDYIDGIDNLYIDLTQIDYSYPFPMRWNSKANTRVVCTPYTPTGKISKYPASLHFATSVNRKEWDGSMSQFHPIMGIINLLKDGNIGSADVWFTEGTQQTLFLFRLFGLSLVIRKVYQGGKCIFNFEEFKNI